MRTKPTDDCVSSPSSLISSKERHCIEGEDTSDETSATHNTDGASVHLGSLRRDDDHICRVSASDAVLRLAHRRPV